MPCVTAAQDKERKGEALTFVQPHAEQITGGSLCQEQRAAQKAKDISVVCDMFLGYLKKKRLHAQVVDVTLNTAFFFSWEEGPLSHFHHFDYNTN